MRSPSYHPFQVVEKIQHREKARATETQVSKATCIHSHRCKSFLRVKIAVNTDDALPSGRILPAPKAGGAGEGLKGLRTFIWMQLKGIVVDLNSLSAPRRGTRSGDESPKSGGNRHAFTARVVSRSANHGSSFAKQFTLAVHCAPNMRTFCSHPPACLTLE